jgi:hypothetical protein
VWSFCGNEMNAFGLVTQHTDPKVEKRKRKTQTQPKQNPLKRRRRQGRIYLKADGGHGHTIIFSFIL